jgi:hypothetical protein
MRNHFSLAELTFVQGGGNLWYVGKVPDDGWDVIRWSARQGSRIIISAVDSKENAERRLWELVRPSSARTPTTIHHCISRPNCDKAGLFPTLY